MKAQPPGGNKDLGNVLAGCGSCRALQGYGGDVQGFLVRVLSGFDGFSSSAQHKGFPSFRRPPSSKKAPWKTLPTPCKFEKPHKDPYTTCEEGRPQLGKP